MLRPEGGGGPAGLTLSSHETGKRQFAQQQMKYDECA